MVKTLIIFGTRNGATEKTVNVIAEILKEKYSHTVEIFEAKKIKKQKLDGYDYNNIIVGSSIVAGRWTKHTKNVLKRNDFTGKKLIIYVSAGGTFRRGYENGLTREEIVENARTTYIDKVIQENSLNPYTTTAFGGIMIFFGKEKYRNWNREEIVNWVNEQAEGLK